MNGIGWKERFDLGLATLSGRLGALASSGMQKASNALMPPAAATDGAAAAAGAAGAGGAGGAGAGGAGAGAGGAGAGGAGAGGAGAGAGAGGAGAGGAGGAAPPAAPPAPAAATDTTIETITYDLSNAYELLNGKDRSLFLRVGNQNNDANLVAFVQDVISENSAVKKAISESTEKNANGANIFEAEFATEMKEDRYGPYTAKAVAAFQASIKEVDVLGIKASLTTDGITGPTTFAWVLRTATENAEGNNIIPIEYAAGNPSIFMNLSTYINSVENVTKVHEEALRRPEDGESLWEIGYNEGYPQDVTGSDEGPTDAVTASPAPIASADTSAIINTDDVSTEQQQSAIVETFNSTILEPLNSQHPELRLTVEVLEVINNSDNPQAKIKVSAIRRINNTKRGELITEINSAIDTFNEAQTAANSMTVIRIGNEPDQSEYSEPERQGWFD